MLILCFSEGADLMVNVLEAKDLTSSDVNHPLNVPLDTYVRVYLLPDKTTNMQTRVSNTHDTPLLNFIQVLLNCMCFLSVML